jgi:hypothetical protein
VRLNVDHQHTSRTDFGVTVFAMHTVHPVIIILQDLSTLSLEDLEAELARRKKTA